ncbi:MAG TPA: ATP-binding protein [Ktedonobacteraceae bacterium]|nr:ATP-binding protein [Ktedonobacteraceae bacterium]
MEELSKGTATRCDRVRIDEVFSNLLTNAIKYNQNPEKWIEIGYILSEEQPTTQPTIFYVRDNGIGIREKRYQLLSGQALLIPLISTCASGKGPIAI